jgi:hypothetical protein
MKIHPVLLEVFHAVRVANGLKYRAQISCMKDDPVIGYLRVSHGIVL